MRLVDALYEKVMDTLYEDPGFEKWYDDLGYMERNKLDSKLKSVITQTLERSNGKAYVVAPLSEATIT